MAEELYEDPTGKKRSLIIVKSAFVGYPSNNYVLLLLLLLLLPGDFKVETAAGIQTKPEGYDDSL